MEAKRRLAPRRHARLCGGFDRGEPPEAEEMPAAERAPIRHDDPVQRSFDSVLVSYTSEVDGPAVRTTRREHLLWFHFAAGGRAIVPALLPGGLWTGFLFCAAASRAAAHSCV